MSIEDVRNIITERVSRSGFDKVIKFDCGDDGILVIKRSEVCIENVDADCTVGLTIDDLLALVNGELNPTMGFMQGKLKIDGSMGVAMKLGSLL